MVKIRHDVDVLEKCPTGIRGLDEITRGGLPRGRPTLVCGSAGSGKTLLAMEFLVRGAMEYGEPGVLMTFEESPKDLAKNFISLGFDLHGMISRGLISMDHVRISTGVPELDAMFGGKGFYRGSTVLVSGMAGTGKTSLSASFADAACRRGERCLYFASEESPRQIIRNMDSIGIRLARWVKKGLLRFHSARPSHYGLEMHLVTFHKVIEEFNPQAFIIDPVSNLIAAGTTSEVKSVLTRLIDIYQQPNLAKAEQIIATPTLIKTLPLPLRRLIGNMSDTERFLLGMDLKPRQS